MTSQSPMPLTNCAYHRRRKLLVARAGGGRRRSTGSPFVRGDSPGASNAAVSLRGPSGIVVDSFGPVTATTSIVTERTAQHPRLTATGSAAMWHGAVTTCTASAVVSPPRPAGPMPVALTAASSSASSAATRGSAAARRSGAAARCLASPPTLSKVAPTPTPTTSGGHAPVAFASTVSSTTRFTPSQPCAGREHRDAARVVRAAALEHHVDGRAGPGRAKRDLDECGRVVAGVGAVEQRVAHDAHAQARVAVRLARPPRRRLACRSPQTHSSAPSSTRTHTVPVSWHSGTPSPRRWRRSRSAAASTARPRAERSRGRGGLQRGEHVGPKLDRGRANRIGARVGDLRRGEHATPGARASRPPRRPLRPTPAARRAPRR